MRRAACLAATVLALGLEAAGAFSTRLWRSTRAAHHRRAATASVLELTDADVATLDADAATSGGRPLLLLDAAAAWCGPCRIMKQVLDKPRAPTRAAATSASPAASSARSRSSAHSG